MQCKYNSVYIGVHKAYTMSFGIVENTRGTTI